MIKRPEQVLVTKSGVCEHDIIVTGIGTATLWLVSAARGVAYLWSAVDTALRVFDDCITSSTVRECHGMSLCSWGETPQTYLLINNEPRKKSTVRSSTTPGHIRALTYLVCCMFALLIFRKTRCLTLGPQVKCTKTLFFNLGSASVFLRQLSMSMLFACRLTLTYVY